LVGWAPWLCRFFSSTTLHRPFYVWAIADHGTVHYFKLPDFENVVGQDSLTRFDQPKRKPNNNKRRKKPFKKNE
jgi:hypothetical protein